MTYHYFICFNKHNSSYPIFRIKLSTYETKKTYCRVPHIMHLVCIFPLLFLCVCALFTLFGHMNGGRFQKKKMKRIPTNQFCTVSFRCIRAETRRRPEAANNSCFLYCLLVVFLICVRECCVGYTTNHRSIALQICKQSVDAITCFNEQSVSSCVCVCVCVM